jgi:hypothetical protein
VPGTQTASLIETHPSGGDVANQSGCIVSVGHLLKVEGSLRLSQIIQEHFKKEERFARKRLESKGASSLECIGLVAKILA